VDSNVSSMVDDCQNRTKMTDTFFDTFVKLEYGHVLHHRLTIKMVMADKFIFFVYRRSIGID
jgi:hypothetical protein